MALRGGDFTTHMDGYNEAHSKMGAESVSRSDDTLLPLIDRDASSSSSKASWSTSIRPTLRRLWSMSQAEHGILLYSSLTLVVTSGVQLSTPYVTGRIIDVSLSPPDGTAKTADPSLWLLGLFGIMSLAALLTYFRQVWQARAGHEFTSRLKQQLYAALISQDAAFYDVTPLGDLLSRLSSDAELVHTAVTDKALTLLRSSIMAMGAASLLLWTSWSLALLSLAVLPPTALLTTRMGRRMKQQHLQVRQSLARATSLADQALTCIRTVQQFNGEAYECFQFHQRVQEAHTQAAQVAQRQAQFSTLVQTVTNGSMLAVLAHGGSLVATGKLSPGSLARFVMYAMIMGGNVSSVSAAYVELMKSIAALHRILQVMDRIPPIPPPRGLDRHSVQRAFGSNNKNDSATSGINPPFTATTTSNDAAPIRPLSIEFRQVNFSYPTRPDVPVLRNFSLSIPPGQVLALVGSSGAGKSTVAALLTRLYDVSEGAIYVDGVNIVQQSPQSLRQSIGIVMQEPLLFPTTIQDNIRYGNINNAAPPETLEHVARLAHVYDFCQAFPKGLGTVVGPRGTQLSGGQKQRVAIARCLYKNPPILILDEATSALDAASEHVVQQAMTAASVGRTVILIAHRLSTIRTAHCIAVLDQGRLVQTGTWEQLQQDENGTFRRLVRHQLLE